MTRFLLHRLGFGLVALLAAAAIGFALAWHAPGGPAVGLFGEDLAPGQAGEAMRRLGLDRHPAEAFAAWLARAATGDLGASWRMQAPVTALLLERLPVTLALMLPAALLAAGAGLALGLAASASRWPAALLAAGHAVPGYIVAQALVAVFALWLGLLPVQGIADPRMPSAGFGAVLDWARHLVLPVVSLALHQLCFLALLIRAGVAAEMALPYTLAARARGMPAPRVRRVHALPNAALPALTLFAARLGGMVGGAVVIETAFGLPGLGRLAVTAALARDHPLVLGCLLLASAAVLLANLLAEALLAARDPRWRSA